MTLQEIQSLFSKGNHIYKITRDLDLGGGTLTLPKGTTLDFQGGNFVNGKVFSDNKTTRVINPPKIEEGVNDEIYWGRFWNQFGQELTYKFEPFNRPFSISCFPFSEENFKFARQCGITEFCVWDNIKLHSDGTVTNDKDSGNVGKDYNESLISKYNIKVKDFRIHIFKNKEDVITITDDTISKIKEIELQLIDRAVSYGSEFIYFDNEEPTHNTDDKFLNLYKELAVVAKSKGLKCGISTYTGDVTVADGRYKDAGFDVLGFNDYPPFSVKGANDTQTIIKESLKIQAENRLRKDINNWSDTNINIGVITETGYSEYNNGMYFVDDRTQPIDESGYIFCTAWRTWLNILAKYSGYLDHINVWGAPTQPAAINQFYNLLLKIG